MAAQLTGTKGPGHPDSKWMARANSSLPVPESPRIKTVASSGATFRAISTARMRAGDVPMISEKPARAGRSAAATISRTAFMFRMMPMAPRSSPASPVTGWASAKNSTRPFRVCMESRRLTGIPFRMDSPITAPAVPRLAIRRPGKWSGSRSMSSAATRLTKRIRPASSTETSPSLTPSMRIWKRCSRCSWGRFGTRRILRMPSRALKMAKRSASASGISVSRAQKTLEVVSDFSTSILRMFQAASASTRAMSATIPMRSLKRSSSLRSDPMHPPGGLSNSFFRPQPGVHPEILPDNPSFFQPISL